MKRHNHMRMVVASVVGAAILFSVAPKTNAMSYAKQIVVADIHETVTTGSWAQWTQPSHGWTRVRVKHPVIYPPAKPHAKKPRQKHCRTAI